MRKLSPFKVLLVAVVVVIVFIAGQHMDFLIGTFWHISHSSKVEYGNVKINVPLGWFPLEREGSLALNKYPKDGTVVLFTNETKHFRRDPKEAVESIGHIFDEAKKVSISGNEGLRITSHVEGGATPYLVFVTLPAQGLTVTYHGSSQGIAAFDSILKGLSFVEKRE